MQFTKRQEGPRRTTSLFSEDCQHTILPTTRSTKTTTARDNLFEQLVPDPPLSSAARRSSLATIFRSPSLVARHHQIDTVFRTPVLEYWFGGGEPPSS